ncbi:hypothetical protein [Paraburkholderia tropica]|uniref:hypothetical protein n=1 Tax=Paraburkholderia tropica TaxID=92647 RepID=UPI002ABE74C6|nr:hypothetical protein [Paraburkholderia tropica]
MHLLHHSPNEPVEALIQSGLQHAAELLDSLLNQNSDYQNARIDAGTFISWLMEDHPAWSQKLAEFGSSELFTHRLKGFLTLAQRRDQLLRHLALAKSQLNCHDVDKLDKRGVVRKAIQSTFPRWSGETVEESIGDAVILLGGSRLFETAAGYPVKHAPQVQRYMVTEISPKLQAARKLANAVQPDTCFLVSRSDAPRSLQEHIHEQVAVVVPLTAKSDAPWIFHCQDGQFTYREVLIEDGDGPISIPLLVGLERGRIFFDYEALRERLFNKLRAELPVLYVSSEATMLATYPFQPFAFAENFYAEVTNFQMGWESDISHGMPFEQRVDGLRRNRFPCHVYVNRFVEDLAHHSVSGSALPDV